MEIKEIHKRSMIKSDPIVYEEKLKKMRKEHEKPIKGLFEFVDAQGGWLEFTSRTFPGESIKTIKIYHGEIVELPKGIVNQLRGAKKKIRKFSKELDPTGRGLPSTYEVQSRITFTPVDM